MAVVLLLLLQVGQFGQHCIEELQLEQSALDRLKGTLLFQNRQHCFGCKL